MLHIPAAAVMYGSVFEGPLIAIKIVIGIWNCTFNVIQVAILCCRWMCTQEKTFWILVNSNQNQIVVTIFRLIWIQINRKMVTTIWFRFALTRILKVFSCVWWGVIFRCIYIHICIYIYIYVYIYTYIYSGEGRREFPSREIHPQSSEHRALIRVYLGNKYGELISFN